MRRLARLPWPSLLPARRRRSPRRRGRAEPRRSTPRATPRTSPTPTAGSTARAASCRTRRTCRRWWPRPRRRASTSCYPGRLADPARGDARQPVPGLERRQPAARRLGRDPRPGPRVAFTNRYGALLRGNVYRPLPGARDPYTGAPLAGRYPGVVMTEGSVQGSEGMYEWLAQDLAERGYVVLTYDVQGQGTSETFPHEDDPLDEPTLPFCNPSPSRRGDGCPASAAAVQLRGRHPRRALLLHLHPDAPLPQPQRRRRRASTRVQPVLAAASTAPPTGDRRRRAGPRGSRSSGTRSAPPRSRRCRPSTAGSPPWWRSTSCRAGLDGRRRPATSRSCRRWRCSRSTASPSRRGSSAAAARSPRSRRPRDRTRCASAHRLRRLAEGRRRLDAGRAARLDPPGVHRHPAGAARQPLRAGALERLRAGLAGPLPQAPRQHRPLLGTSGSATSSRPATARGRRSRLQPRLAAELLLLLGVLPRRRRRDGDITDVGC